MRNKHALVRVRTLLIIASALFLFSLPFSSCGKDEPANPVHNHRPPNGNDSDNQNNDNEGDSENNENGDDNGGVQEETAPIVGTWIRNDNAEKLAFGKDGRYAAYLNENAIKDKSRVRNEITRKDDEDSSWREYESGHYIYHDLSRILWIETKGEDGDLGVEYKCVFGNDGSLTLWSLDNKSRKFKRI